MVDGGGSAEVPITLKEEESVTEQNPLNPWLHLTPQIISKTSPKIDESKPKAPSEEASARMEIFLEDYKVKEKLGIAIFDIAIDRDKLNQIEVPEREAREWKGETSEEAKQELQEVLERFKKLPEKLHFEPGVTLIVGENGAGKSTLARALQFAAEYQESVSRNKVSAALAKNESEFVEAEDVMHRVIYEPHDNLGRLAMNAAGIAPQVAQAVDVKDFNSYRRSGMGIKYTDFTEAIGSRNRGEWDHALNMLSRGDHSFQGDNNHRSHRQTVDSDIFDNLKQEKEWYEGPRIYFFDEPETAMSPRRHMQIAAELLDVTSRGSIVIVPTNSTVLFSSDLPRIDLDYPERGIHHPSQYLPANS